MNVQNNENLLAMMKFGVGQSVPRKEDNTLLQGEGRYTDDVNLPNQVHQWMLRSPVAHGIIKSIDLSQASAMPGVLAIITQADLDAAGITPTPPARMIPGRNGTQLQAPPNTALAANKVTWAGQPVAAVIAETLNQAKDAAEAIYLDIEQLPAVTTVEAAIAEGAPQLHEECAGNIALDFQYGDAAAVDAAFAVAAHVTTVDLISNRIVVNCLEPRASVINYDPVNEHWTCHIPTQGVFGQRAAIANNILHVPPEKVRVHTLNVGGSFGMKAGIYPEYICGFQASRLLGRPVKWADDRSGSFLSDNQGRDHEMIASLALDKEGNFLAVRVIGYGNVGAYPNLPIPCTMNVVKNVITVYRTPAIEVATKVVLTNSTPIGAYRGAGRPEGNYYMERLIDTAAHEMGIDRLEIRRRNHIRPEQMPYKTPTALVYDSGEFTALFDQALAQADFEHYEERKAESARNGKLRGLGVCSFLEVTAPAGPEMGGIQFDEDGGVTILTGTYDYGQGHASPFAQMLVDQLGIPFDKIRLMQTDSDKLIAGGGTGGSRSMMASGTAIIESSKEVVKKGTQLAAHVLEAAEQDIRFADGRFTIAGTDRSIGIMELADKLRGGGLKLPPELPVSLDAQLVTKADYPSAFPNGCHVAEVEIDPDTGVIQVVKYLAVNDFGVMVNPMIVAGQAHGGIVQAIGQAILERVVYDGDGQMLTGSFQDYAMPRADDVPSFTLDSHPVPATTNPVGAKGCGEAGCAGGLPSVMNAVVDALRPVGIHHIDMPCTPEKVWRMIREARGQA